VLRHYPALLPGVRAMLAVFCSMALAERTRPLSVIFESGSGNGKTAVVQMAFPEPGCDPCGGLNTYVYRSDKFTPKAFVSHAANVKRNELEKVDMLPRLRSKVLLTKELAPIFRGREEELKETFSTLIAVLDGKGYTSDSGTHGRRGYSESILFNWIGATTPLPPATHRLMSQLGTRLLFFELPTVAFSDAELLAYAARDTADVAEKECQHAVNEFLTTFFAAHPVGSVSPASVAIPEIELRALVRWARLLVAGRAEVLFERDGTNWVPVAAMPPEGPHKVINYLKDLARGNALAHGRSEVNAADVDLVGEVSISSIPGTFRPVVRELRRNAPVDTQDVMRLCRVSAPTARNYLDELRLLGIVKVVPGTQKSVTTATLARDFRWVGP
jgi:hypothetical protein